MRAILMGLSVLLLSAGVSFSALAEGKGDQKPAGKTASSAEVTDAQIKKFAVAQQSIQETLKANQNTMKEGSAKEKAQLQEKMVKAIKEAGLTVASFNAIGQQIQNDPSLKQRYMKQMSQ